MLPRERKGPPVAKIVLSPEWLVGTNPDTLLSVVWQRRVEFAVSTSTRNLPPATVRRLRVYGTACARMVWDMLSTDLCNAVRFAEGHAYGRATMADLRAAAVRMRYGAVTFQQHAANAVGWGTAGYWESTPPDPTQDLVWNPAEAAREAAKALATRTAGPAPPGGTPVAKEWQYAWNRAFAAAREHQAELVRDIFPPPGYTPALSPEWRTSTVLALARQMDETGDFTAVPILADALQDAGCENELMLDRCRAPSGVHCRGNWVVDLVLGRE
jgi:hypothetical protein